MSAPPLPPLTARLSEAQRLALACGAAALYGVIMWWALAPDTGGVVANAAAIALVTLPLAAARRLPLLALALAVGGLCLSPLSDDLAFAALVPVSYALFQVAAQRRPAVALPALTFGVIGSVATALPDFEHRGAVIPFALVFITTWTLGYAVRQQRVYLDRLAAHHREVAEAEVARARRRVVEERLDMARELHDVVAHAMSVITVQAGYGRLVFDQQPARARNALGVIEETGRQALVDMRALMTMLRRGPDQTVGGYPSPVAPTPGMADLDSLIDAIARAGVHVDLVVAGTPRDLPTALDLTAYRILQEALTNVVKHAGVSRARASITYDDEGLTLSVIDSGRGSDRAPRPTHTGHGLLGMRERVAIFGGRLEAAALPGQGFRVAARLPSPTLSTTERPSTAGAAA